MRPFHCLNERQPRVFERMSIQKYKKVYKQTDRVNICTLQLSSFSITTEKTRTNYFQQEMNLSQLKINKMKNDL